MELINIRNNKRVYVKDEDIVDGIYHFKYKIDFSQTPEKIQKDKEYISKLKYQIALYDIKSDNLYLINRDQVYNKVFNENYRFITFQSVVTIKLLPVMEDKTVILSLI